MTTEIMMQFKMSPKPITYFAELLGVTRQTMYNRIKNPQFFSYKDIRILRENGVHIEKYL